MDVLVTILAIEAATDSFYVFSEPKGAFANGGYNAYAMGMESERVLYALGACIRY